MTFLDRLRGLCDFAVAADAGRGIITTADAGYFPGAQMLIATCAGRVPLAIYDAGLTPEQREWCRGRATVLEMPPLVIPRSVTLWQSWNKPVMFHHSPFRTTLWLDADCLVVGDPTPMFEHAEACPFGICSMILPYLKPNKESLYERFPVPARISHDFTVNSGVLGFSRDARSAALLKTWHGMVSAAAADDEVRNSFGYVEEGALHWAMEALQMHDFPIPNFAWNRFSWATGRGGPDAFFERVKVKPGDVVLHLINKPKVWKMWSEFDAPVTF